MLYQIAADLILFVHVMFVVFVVLGLFTIIIGKVLQWSWVRNAWFRLTHLLAIAIVVIQSWLGIICPLTVWEMKFRALAGDVVYAGSFVAHWLNALLYYQAPAWVFITIYTVFGSLVVFSWFWVRPHPITWRAQRGANT